MRISVASWKNENYIAEYIVGGGVGGSYRRRSLPANSRAASVRRDGFVRRWSSYGVAAVGLWYTMVTVVTVVTVVTEDSVLLTSGRSMNESDLGGIHL